MGGLPSRLVLGEYRFEGNTREKAALNTLEVLNSNGVQLEELNLSSAQIFNSEQAKKMVVLLEKAIKRSSASLKKIHLKANQASVNAMENTTLPRLIVFDVSVDLRSSIYGVDNLSRYNSDKALCQILTVVHTEAGPSTRCTVRELNLHALNLAPALTFESCPALFLGVKKLSLTFRDGSDQTGIATFIASFKNLESLTWTANQEVMRNVDNMETIFTACHELKHINLAHKSPKRQSDVIGIPLSSTAMKNFFRSFRGQLQTVNLYYLTSEQIKVLGETSPNLTSLYLSIDRETVKALPLLFGTHCRQLRELHLEYSRQDIFWFGKNSWSALSNAVCSASPCFHTVSFIDGTQHTDRATWDMVGAIIEILEFMGDRAKKVWFKISMRSSSPVVVLRGLWRTLDSAVVHCKSIQSLCLDFLPGFGRYNFTRNLSRSEEKKVEILFCYRSVCKLQKSAESTLQYLEEFDVGSIDNVRLYFRDGLRSADRASRFHSLY